MVKVLGMLLQMLVDVVIMVLSITLFMVMKDVNVLILLVNMLLCTILIPYQLLLEVMKNLLVLSMMLLGMLIITVLDLVLKELLKMIVFVLLPILNSMKLLGINGVIVNLG
jgi:hypothetical protein